MGCDALEDGRGVAVADLNDDGRLDLVVGTNNGRPIIYMNNQPQAGNWLRVDLGGGRPGCGRDALGARVEVVVDHGGQRRTITRWVEAGAGYAAQSEYTLHFGLGQARAVESLSVTWPGLPPRRFTKEELGEVLNETVTIDGGTARVRKRQARLVTARQTRESVRGQ
jgi:enediyne biosynthesis protein E4